MRLRAFHVEYLRLKKNSIEKKSGSLSVSCFGNFGRIERHGYLNRTMLETWFHGFWKTRWGLTSRKWTQDVEDTLGMNVHWARELATKQ